MVVLVKGLSFRWNRFSSGQGSLKLLESITGANWVRVYLINLCSLHFMITVSSSFQNSSTYGDVIEKAEAEKEDLKAIDITLYPHL